MGDFKLLNDPVIVSVDIASFIHVLKPHLQATVTCTMSRNAQLEKQTFLTNQQSHVRYKATGLHYLWYSLVSPRFAISQNKNKNGKKRGKKGWLARCLLYVTQAGLKLCQSS